MEDLVCIILYISLMIEDIFWVSLMQNREEAYIFYLQREVGKFVHVFAETKVTLKWIMNSNMVKPEKVDHLHLLYHFTVPLILIYVGGEGLILPSPSAPLLFSLNNSEMVKALTLKFCSFQ